MTAKTAKTASRFQRGSACFTCRACGRATRATGGNDNEHIRLCVDCCEIAGIYNTYQDEGADGIREYADTIRAHAANITAKGGTLDSDALELLAIANAPAVTAPAVTLSHYFGTTAFTWAVAQTREEVIAALARDAGKGIIAAQVKANGGLYCWTVRVDLPQSANYEISYYKPVGVPLADAVAFNIISAKGKAVALAARGVQS